ncbi:MAG TPA: hypothetical protein VLM36_10220 [Sphingomicrobium sp.]|nr:hypothetical protein [Sphingomicrobium sp.]
MTSRSVVWATVAVAALAITACKTTQAPAPAAAGEVSAGTPTPAPSTGSGAGTSIPTLVNVNLQNVLNNLSVSLKVNRDNIPVTAQVPIDVAANVCGVSVSALAAAIANGQAGCTATTTTPQLTQAVQQQIASGGSVTGGAQTMGAPSSATTNNLQ